MHELIYLTEILAVTLDFASQHNLNKIEVVLIEIDKEIGFVDESVNFYWNHLTEKTIATESLLKVKRIAAIYCCLTCLKIFHKKLATCTKCGSNHIDYQQQIRIVQIEGQINEKNH
jgi:hydrogenase nickel incorporation protein HypA/HybF